LENGGRSGDYWGCHDVLVRPAEEIQIVQPQP
jgi:hypothetical protein